MKKHRGDSVMPKTSVTFCGHDDYARRRTAPVSLLEGAEVALFCAPCGVAQLQAAEAFQQDTTLKRRKVRRADGQQNRGTCEMCHEFDLVSVATQPDGPDALRWKRLCEACNSSVTRPKAKQPTVEVKMDAFSFVSPRSVTPLVKGLKRRSGGAYVEMDLRTLNDRDSWRVAFPKVATSCVCVCVCVCCVCVSPDTASRTMRCW